MTAAQQQVRESIHDHHRRIASSLDNRPQFKAEMSDTSDKSVPVQHITTDDTDGTRLTVTEDTNLSFAIDQRQARISAMTEELQERHRIIAMVSQFGGFQQFQEATAKLAGHLDGLKESLVYVPAQPAPLPPAFLESEGN